MKVLVAAPLSTNKGVLAPGDEVSTADGYPESALRAWCSTGRAVQVEEPKKPPVKKAAPKKPPVKKADQEEK